MVNNSSNSRLAQFELLRILAMFGVVLNHVFNYGLDIYGDFRVDASQGGGFVLWSVLELLKLMALPSVNCYILITGYFLIDKTQLRLRGIWKVWSTTWVYAVGIYLLAVAVGINPFDRYDLARHALPLISNSYWFVTSYIALMLLCPLLAWGLQHVSKRQFQAVLVVGGLVCFQPLGGRYLMDDQQIVLFVYLFMIGGYIRRYHEKSAKTTAALLAYLGILMMMYAYTVYKNQLLDSQHYTIFAMAYHGLVLPLSVAFFLFMKNMSIGNLRMRKAILAVAPLSFAVYIIHTHSTVHALLWTAVSHSWPHVGMWALPLYCVAVAAAVFVVGVLMEFCRVRLARIIAAHI